MGLPKRGLILGSEQVLTMFTAGASAQREFKSRWQLAHNVMIGSSKEKYRYV